MLRVLLIEYEIPARSADVPRKAPDREPEHPLAAQKPVAPERFVDDKVFPVMAPVPVTANGWALNAPCRLVLSVLAPKFTVNEAEFSVPVPPADPVTGELDKMVE